MRARDEHTQPAERRGLAARVDPGWLFLAAGLALVAALVVLPAMRDLDHARYHRDRAVSLEQHRLERLERYSAYHAALGYRDPLLLRRLAASQLNRQPEGTEFIVLPAHHDSADVFSELEPAYTPPRPPRDAGSLLEKLATHNTARLWLLALGGLCVVYGLLPAATRAKAR